ncbi:hypothetical protein GO013_09640 [Pseudodesulfovibrio sp. JC047]|uniref:hypothetical protein n=1 Tax=Pseudodesulfovibrio sp. JC047 TaxID=2683199 RepID=UPI0013D135F1|nr:hypothetical protein [Pseudodesulfovibrio sp. JC047]NDV19680.1 hypothetical protein [Pseudodesulfovibrio sp. JC047]
MPETQRIRMKQMLAEQLDGQMEAHRSAIDTHIPVSEQTLIRENMDALCLALGLARKY